MDHSFARTETIYWAAVGALVVLFALVLGLQLFDKRMVGGESNWTKPLKFHLALAVHFATLALATSTLGDSYRASPLLLAVAVAAVASAGFELAYMTVQAARLQMSHFNRSTPFHTVMYALMAVGAVLITLAAGVVGLAVWLDKASSVGSVLRTAIALGLIGGTVLTLIVAFRMGAALSHHVGIEEANAARVPFFGWSRTVGDLRVPHFLATHMMQVLPIAGLAIERVASGPIALALIWIIAAVWSTLTAYAFNRALAGQPFL
jgi:hypothetical protein